MSQTREQAAVERILYALDRLQEAQNLVGDAGAALSSIIGMVPDHERLSKLYQTIRREWYRLDARRGKNAAAIRDKRKALMLDGEPEERYKAKYTTSRTRYK